MKKVLCLFLALVLVFALIGCGKSKGDTEFRSGRFVLIETTKGAAYYKENIFCDTETGVLYLGVRDPMGNLAVTVLMQPDGTPITYDEYVPAHFHEVGKYADPPAG